MPGAGFLCGKAGREASASARPPRRRSSGAERRSFPSVFTSFSVYKTLTSSYAQCNMGKWALVLGTDGFSTPCEPGRRIPMRIGKKLFLALICLVLVGVL